MLFYRAPQPTNCWSAVELGASGQNSEIKRMRVVQPRQIRPTPYIRHRAHSRFKRDAITDRFGRRCDQERYAAFGDAFYPNGINFLWHGEVTIVAKDVRILFCPLEGRGCDFMHCLWYQSVKRERCIETYVGRTVDARRKAIGMYVTLSRVEPASELENLASVYHPGDFPALVTHVSKPVLNLKSVNYRIWQMLICAHFGHDSFI